MSDPYHNPEKFDLVLVYEANAGESYTFDMLIILRKADGSLLMGTDSGCSCPSPFEDQGLQDLEVATPEAINEWFENPDYSPRRNRLGADERQRALSLFTEVPMKDQNLDKEISETEGALKKLYARREANAKRTSEMEVASKLHGLLCHSDHTEGCFWFYEQDLNKVERWGENTHARCLVKATAIIKEIGAEAAIKFLDILERTKA